MSGYSQEAYELQLALEAGLVDRNCVILWADRILESHEYDDAVAEVALAVDKSRQDLARLLAKVADRPDEWLGLRKVLREMYETLREDPKRASGFAAFLEQFWILHHDEIPAEEFYFLAGIGDRFDLAEQGLCETVEEATTALMADLSHFVEGGHGS